jgi:hypothetical protein
MKYRWSKVRIWTPPHCKQSVFGLTINTIIYGFEWGGAICLISEFMKLRFYEIHIQKGYDKT